MVLGKTVFHRLKGDYRVVTTASVAGWGSSREVINVCITLVM